LSKLNEFAESELGRSVVVVGIALDSADAQDLENLARRRSLRILLVRARDEKKTAEAFRLTRVPSTFVIGESGIVSKCFGGTVSAGELAAEFDRKR
jgi:hypothetical protein